MQWILIILSLISFLAAIGILALGGIVLVMEGTLVLILSAIYLCGASIVEAIKRLDKRKDDVESGQKVGWEKLINEPKDRQNDENQKSTFSFGDSGL
jgi:hypothetical protein